MRMPSLLRAPAGKPRRGELRLINPRYRRNPLSCAGRHALAPSLALPTIAAATPPDYQVRLHDENLSWRDAPMRPVPEVVGITVHTAFAPRAYALAQRFRRLGAQVVLGGLHVSALPEEARRHADVVVLGDGVAVWEQVLARHPTAAQLARTVLYKKQDWIWRALVPLGLTRAAWRPLLALHRSLRRGRPRLGCGTLGSKMTPARGRHDEPRDQALAA